MSERIEVQRTIPADAATIFDVVRDPFVIHMDREALGDFPMGKYDVTVTITAYEQDRLITWEVSGENFPSIGHYYGYRLEPAEGGTLVTSVYDWSAVSEKWKPEGRWPIIQESALKATLGILERTLRSSSVIAKLQ